MTQLASSTQLRQSFVRWALLCVPTIVFLGFLSGRVSNSGYGNAWFAALNRPAIMPPGWVFGVAWTILYILIGLALAHVLNARGAAGRPLAIALFLAQMVANLAWSPTFFLAHKVFAAFLLILVTLALAAATTATFWRIRNVAAWLMLPYLAWLSFASILNWQVHKLNPQAETLEPQRSHTQIEL